MRYVLKLQHWQLFLIIFVLPFVFYISFIISIVVNAMGQLGENEFPFSGIAYVTIPLVIITFISAAVHMLSWSFQVATGLHKKLPPGSGMKIRRFYFAFFYPMAYIIVVCIGAGIFALITLNGIKTSGEPSPAIFGWFFLIIPFHFLAIACAFYTLYFNAKSLKSVELQRPVTASDYTAEFVLMWFFFIGIFFIQPRINKIFEEGNDTPVKDLSQI